MLCNVLSPLRPRVILSSKAVAPGTAEAGSRRPDPEIVKVLETITAAEVPMNLY